jgi:S-DNA-T family DNA segregation ATPase FtsK/SpoIIIE
MTFNWAQSQLPIINNDYTPFILLVLTFIFFTLASNINYKYFLFNPTRIFKIFKKSEKIETSVNNNFDNTSDIINDEKIDKPQQSFLFDKILEPKKPAVKNTEIKNFKLPSVDLLEKPPSKINLLDQSKNRPEGEFIEKILLDFGVDGKIKKINNGPVVSLYEFEPAPGVKVSKIINLSDDLARNTSSTSARVSTIPGKNTVGIEIPNESRESVYLKEIVVNEKFQKKEIKLPIALGKSISGMPLIGDLTSMPHLLIAGTTGSGKSVCINTIIVSLTLQT